MACVGTTTCAGGGQDPVVVWGSPEARLIRDTTRDGLGNSVLSASHLAHVGEFVADLDQGRFFLPFLFDAETRKVASQAERVMLHVSYGARGNTEGVSSNGARVDLAVDLYGFERRSHLSPRPEDYQASGVSLLVSGAVGVQTPVERYLSFDVTEFVRRQAAVGSVAAFRFQIQQEEVLPNSDGLVNRYIFHSPNHATRPPWLEIVSAAPRQFLFHHWSLQHQPKYATGALVRDGADIEYWSGKGVVAQRWRGGRWAYVQGFDTPERLADHWLAPSEFVWPGIVIDEITGQPDSRDVMGEALLIARERRPDLYIAAYVVPHISREKLVAGLREGADLVLIEAYETSARSGYARVASRWESAVTHDLVDKSIVALGLSQTWITTPQELRRQLHFIRYHSPEAPGVGFFGEAPRDLYESIDEYLGNYFAGPSLRAEVVESGRLRVENIGGRESPAAEVRSFLGPDQEYWTVSVPPLVSGGSFMSDESQPGAIPWTEFREEGYQVLGPPLLWDKEWPELRPGALDPWPFAGSPARSVTVDFSEDPGLNYSVNQSGDPGYDGNREGAWLPIPDTVGDSVAFQFDLALETVGRYGRIAVGLGRGNGQSQLDFELYRNDGEPGAYALFSARNEDGLLVREDIAVLLMAGDRHRLVAAYSPGRYVRARIVGLDGGTVWDTGRLPLAGLARFDRVRFGVTAGEGSLLEWDAAAENLQLRGQFPNSNFRIQGRVEAFEVAYFADGPVDRWKAEWFTPRELDDPSRTGDGASFSGDETPNLFKYLFGLNPRLPSSDRFPRMEKRDGEGVVVFPLAGEVPGVEWKVEASGDLVHWREEPAPTVAEESADEGGWIYKRIPLDQGGDRVFVRLLVRRS